MDITRLYGDLMKSCTRNGHEQEFKNSAHFVPVKGTKYSTAKVKLMVIGRSVNKWDSLPTDSEEIFGKAAENKFFDNEGFSSYFSFFENKMYNTKDYISYKLNPDNKNKPKPLSSNFFWRYTKEIYSKLGGIIEDDLWIENIIWDNLYKISPKRDGESTQTWIANAQLYECKYILRKEIEYFKPDYILFLTGADWTEDFRSEFDTYGKFGTNIARGKNKNNIYVESFGTIQDIPAVVMCRPELRDIEPYTNDAVEAFQYLRRKVLQK